MHEDYVDGNENDPIPSGFTLYTNTGKVYQLGDTSKTALEPYEGEGNGRLVGFASNKRGTSEGHFNFIQFILSSNPVWFGKVDTATAKKMKLPKPKDSCPGVDMECKFGYILDG